MSKLLGVSLYFTSFMPLWIAIIFVDVRNCINETENLMTEKISILCILLFFVINAIILIYLLYNKKKINVQQKLLISAKEEKAITAEYLLSYVMPMFAFDFTHWDQVVLFLIFFVFLGILSIWHNYFVVNIFMEMLGFRVYKCELLDVDGIKTECKVVGNAGLKGQESEVLYFKAINNDYKLVVDQKKISKSKEELLKEEFIKSKDPDKAKHQQII